MRGNRNDHVAYVRKVQEGTQSLAQDLLSEVERLQVLVAALEAEKGSLEDRARETPDLARVNEALRALLASLEAEMNRLHEQSVVLRAENERHQKEQARLQAQLEAIRAESQRFSARFLEVEQQNSNLANLYVASYRLHGTLDRKEVVATLQEIIANLVGSEEAALFELDEASQTLRLTASFGLEAEGYREVSLGFGIIGGAVRSGEIWTADRGEPRGTGAEENLSACIPLTLDGKVTGAIAIFRLLPQKAGIEEVDRELFELLATHAANALYCTRLHEQTQVRVAG